jgi:hypothetical protein
LDSELELVSKEKNGLSKRAKMLLKVLQQKFTDSIKGLKE